MVSLHVLSGIVALLAGALALISGKGGRLHRRSGSVFVYAMMVMASLGVIIGAIRSQPMNVVAGSLTFYLVTTALLAVQKPAWAFDGIERVAAWFAVALGLSSLAAVPIGLVKMTALAVPVIVFGAVALLTGLADFRAMRRVLVGRRRIARHLWRMGLALWIATASFFLGQAKVFPESIRSSGALALPVVLVLAVIAYWIVRVSFMKERKTPWESDAHASAATGRKR